jgi:hypothetical protein
MRDYVAAKNRIEDAILGRIARQAKQPLTNTRSDNRPSRREEILVYTNHKALAEAKTHNIQSPFLSFTSSDTTVITSNIETMSTITRSERSRQPYDKGNRRKNRFAIPLKELAMAN